MKAVILFSDGIKCTVFGDSLVYLFATIELSFSDLNRNINEVTSITITKK